MTDSDSLQQPTGALGVRFRHNLGDQVEHLSTGLQVTVTHLGFDAGGEIYWCEYLTPEKAIATLWARPSEIRELGGGGQ